MYEAITDNIRVTVLPQFVEGQSDAAQDKYFWAYTITMENRSLETVTLLTRHWVITDGRGRSQDVRGDGVVGEQPTLAPGQSFQYTSGCPLKTTSGTMVGSYNMMSTSGRSFSVAIPAFSLDSPYDKHMVN